MTTWTNHRHRAIPERARDRCFSGPVGTRPNPAAHGGITRTDYCRCGAERNTNINGWHVERGSWYVPARAAREEAGS